MSMFGLKARLNVNDHLGGLSKIIVIFLILLVVVKFNDRADKSTTAKYFTDGCLTEASKGHGIKEIATAIRYPISDLCECVSDAIASNPEEGSDENLMQSASPMLTVLRHLSMWLEVNAHCAAS